MVQYNLNTSDDLMIMAIGKRLQASGLTPEAYLMQLATRDLVEQELLPAEHLNRDQQVPIRIAARHEKMLRYMADKNGNQDQSTLLLKLVDAHLQKMQTGAGNPELGQFYKKLMDKDESRSREMAICMPSEQVALLNRDLAESGADKDLFFTSIIEQEWKRTLDSNQYVVGYHVGIRDTGTPPPQKGERAQPTFHMGSM